MAVLRKRALADEECRPTKRMKLTARGRPKRPITRSVTTGTANQSWTPQPPAAPTSGKINNAPPPRRDNTKLFNSTFMEMRTISNNVTAGDLKNKPLAVFSKRLFPKDCDYAAITPSLRLASKILTSRRLEPFLLALVDHEDMKNPSKNRTTGKQFVYTEADSRDKLLGDSHAHKTRRQKIATALAALADMVKFDRSNEIGGGLTQCSKDPNMKSMAFRQGKGVGSYIWYSGSAYSELVSARKKNDNALLLWHQWHFGLMLAHVGFFS